MTLLYAAQEIKKYYNGMLALDLQDFSLEKGAALILEGPNGSGKSTFLRILAFLEEPSSGSLKFFGGPEPRRDCTLLLQEPWLLRASAFANVTLGLRLRGERGDLKPRYCEAMRSAGFSEPEKFEKRMPAALSGGERQRVALAARLILNPVALLLDEPTAHVDSASEKHIIAALLNARESGMTIICATHDASLAKTLDAQKMVMARPA